ncbi:hypothetical protein [Mesorhizobium sp. ES1-4]|uniref:hypothetical protein n=1 Tax=Mesorhizobium sp. ES1-4 TaxID=2876627 RepID=UPI001CCA7641|nr:hypothetical protein [Mesorhizobium sp. ES1-4]MBZ9799927.1 hypothetical protein [Mesorhizobium sp. ES1-4]
MRDPTPASVRGEIDEGATQDKTPGFDPAIAPLETDAEAADTRNPLPKAEPPRSGEPTFKNAASSANAMRPIESEAEPRPGSNWPLLVIAGVVLVAAAVFLAAGMLR